MTANIYEKLDEAQTLFLNPTYEMLHKGYDLATYCYYKLKHYPNFNDPIWTYIDIHDFVGLDTYLKQQKTLNDTQNNTSDDTQNKTSDDTQTNDVVINAKNKKPKKETTKEQIHNVAHEHFMHNVTKAVHDHDDEYLNYLALHKPKRKITLVLKKNSYIIDLELAKKFGITNSSELNGLNLKKNVNKYIYDQHLQEGALITLDLTLQQLLDMKVDNTDIFNLHRQFKKKYLA